MRMSVHRGDDAGDAFIGMLSGALGAELGKQDAQSRESEFGHYAGRGKNLTAHQKIVVVVTLLKAKTNNNVQVPAFVLRATWT